MIQLKPSFKDNLQALPSVQNIALIELLDQKGTVVASIENIAGKQGSLAVYNYLQQAFGTLDAKAALFGVLIFAEHGQDAMNRPGVHPNVDRLFEIIAGSAPLAFNVVSND